MMNNSITRVNENHTDFDDDEVFDDSFLANLCETINKAKSEFKVNDSLDKSTFNVSALCCDEEISGYDKLTGKTWIYPTNYPVRDYQFNIIKAAILKNTLVSLPTGLGKTFIAAVIMHNFFRWYPLGKIVFTAPTRPLVAQQIEACYNIVAMPKNDTIEMTGHMKASTRQMHWKNKRVFFATPQVIYNDIKSGICPGDKIRCLVIDEAHRARGNYAYCQIVQSLTEMGHNTYRILALSATPGSKVDDVINVVKNLHIAKLELRSESCIDVAPYSHSKKINTVVVELGSELTHLRHQYIEILDDYARRLKQLNILPQNVGNLSKGRIVMLYKEFQNKDRSARHPQHNNVMKDFTLLIALFHGLELLLKHGSRVFLNFFDEHPEKTWVQYDDRLTSMLERLRDDLGVNPLSLNTSVLPDGTVPEVPRNLSFGHPKFYKLKEIMLRHFTKAKEEKQDTRAIVFCEYRESVNLVHCLLLQCRPLIVPQMFVGQGASGKNGAAVVSQKQQLRVMRSFRAGGCNALVATCVAEEGLDVGSVDLILCFDVSTRSPIRLVQRCGRTGRERGGQVFILVTEGREHQTLKDCMQQRDGLNKKIMQSKEVENNLYQMNPRMIPYDFMPTCQKMHIVVKNHDASAGSSNDNTKKGQKDLRNMLQPRASTSGIARSINTNKNADVDIITKSEFDDVFPEGFQVTAYFEQPKEFWAMSKATIKEASAGTEDRLKLNTWLEWQRTLQNTVNIGHSNDTEILSALLQYSDAKRFELPVSTQNPTFNTQIIPSEHVVKSSPTKLKQPKKKKLVVVQKSPSKKDGDIRALFSTATKSTKNYTKLISDLGIQSDGTIPTSLVNLFVDLSLNSTKSSICYICQSICNCTAIKKTTTSTPPLSKFLNEPILPDVRLIDDINVDMLLKITTHNEKSQDVLNQQIDFENNNFDLDVNKMNDSTNFDLQFDFESPIECSNDMNDNIERNLENTNQNVDDNFDLGVLEDLFEHSSPEGVFNNNIALNTEHNSSDPKEALGFFGLNSIDDIFADSDDEITNANLKTTEKIEKKPEKNNNENPFQLSPSILSGRIKSNTNVSPILGSQVRKFQLSVKKSNKQSSTPLATVKRQLVMDPLDNKTIESEDSKVKSLIDTSNESKLTITQLVNMINKSETEKSILQNCNVSDGTQIINSRSSSPVLLTQADRKIMSLNDTTKFLTASPNLSNKVESLIILESDSDSNETQIYELEHNKNELKDTSTDPSTPTSSKRKLEIDDTNFVSPYFSKRVKLDNDTNKALKFKEKILAASTSSQTKQLNNDSNIHFMVQISQKENMDPQTLVRNKNTKQDLKDIIKSKLDIFKKTSRLALTPPKQNTLLSSNIDNSNRKLYANDSDDDFVFDDKLNDYQSPKNLNKQSTTNHKVRKKKRKQNSFLDLEAELSDSEDESGDELTDDSAGSIAEFICDDNVTHEDIHAHYLESIKNPVTGVFKIPQLPTRFDKHDVFSQFVEEDNYEMDSFCVDSNVGLTQVNDVSELELAEIALERKRAKKSRKKTRTDEVNYDGPLVRRRYKVARIQSDSEDST